MASFVYPNLGHLLSSCYLLMKYLFSGLLLSTVRRFIWLLRNLAATFQTLNNALIRGYFMTSSLLILFITNFMVFNWPKFLSMTALLLHPSHKQMLSWPTFLSQWDIGELLASLCFVLVSLSHLLTVWLPSLIFIPKVNLFWPCYLLLLLLPIFLYLLSVVCLLLTPCFPQNPSFSAFCPCTYDFYAGL